MSMFETVGEGFYDPSTDKLTMRKVDDVDHLSDILSVDDVCDLVNDHLTYKPGWTFHAYVVRSAYGDHVNVDIEYVTDESDPKKRNFRSSIGGSTKAINNMSHTLFSDTRERVEVAILAMLMEAEAHETSEFLRIDGFAPFHAHRRDGQERWSDAQSTHAGLPNLAL